jgi:hypothetical protein
MRLALSTSLWVYGMSITLLLVGLWGRAVVSDRATMEQAASEAAAAAVVSDRVAGWVLDSAAGELRDLPPGIEATAAAVLSDPAARRLVDEVVGELVAAAMAPPGSTAVIDLGEHLRRARPHLQAAAVRLGAPEAANVLDAVAASIEPVRLPTGDGSPVGAGISNAGAALRLAVVAAGVTGLVAAAAALGLSTERRHTARQLAVRAGLSGLGFAVMMRLGSWALDPGGGSAPAAPSLRRAGALLLAAGLHLPLLVGLAGTGSWVALRRRRRTDDT